jgi:hypothetical protein
MLDVKDRRQLQGLLQPDARAQQDDLGNAAGHLLQQFGRDGRQPHVLERLHAAGQPPGDRLPHPLFEAGVVGDQEEPAHR